MKPEISISTPSVAIILVNWNGYEFTSACINSLLKISYPNYKIILVDNGSQDKSGTRLKKEFDDITLISLKENLGFCGGNNAGMRYAVQNNYDYCLLLNNDTETEAQFLEHLVEGLNKNPKCAAIQPKIYYMHNKQLLWNAGGLYNSHLGIPSTIGLNKKNKPLYDESRFTDWITGCCILIKTSVIKEIGLLDEQFFAYFEDVDWSLRMRKAGYKLLYEPRSVIYHVAGASSKSSEKNKEGKLNPIIHYYNVRNHLYLIRKHSKGLNRISSFTFQFLKIIAYSLYFSIRLRFKKLKFALKGFKDGFKMEIQTQQELK